MKTSALTQAGVDRLHQAMAARAENDSLPGIVTLVAQGDDVYVDVLRLQGASLRILERRRNVHTRSADTAAERLIRAAIVAMAQLARLRSTDGTDTETRSEPIDQRSPAN